MASHTVLINSFFSTTGTSLACISAVYPRVVDSFCVLVQLPNMPRVCCVVKLCHVVTTLKVNYRHIFSCYCSLLCTAPIFALSLETVHLLKLHMYNKCSLSCSLPLPAWLLMFCHLFFPVEECSSSPQPRDGRDAPW